MMYTISIFFIINEYLNSIFIKLTYSLFSIYFYMQKIIQLNLFHIVY